MKGSDAKTCGPHSLLKRQRTALAFGRDSQKLSRRQTRFLFYMVLLDLVKDVSRLILYRPPPKHSLRSIPKLYQEGTEDDANSSTQYGGRSVDGYLTRVRKTRL